MFKTVLMKVSKSMDGILRDTKSAQDARIARIYEGTNEINRMLSVGMLIKKSDEGTC
jgi:alkylation response protein AidB-like acyl-CoA dehydrogenase